MEILKNDILDCVIDDLGSAGEGIAHVENKAVFITNALPGERVRAVAVFVKPSFIHAKLLEVMNPSKNRTVPLCPVFQPCGGCSLQHLAYESQLEFKRNQVANSLKKYAGEDFPVEDTCPSQDVFYYRNKLSLPVRSDKNGGLKAGFFGRNSHRVVACETCFIQKKSLFSLAKKLLKTLEESGADGYDEETGKGLVRHLVMRELGGRTTAAVVVNGAFDAHVEALKRFVSENGEDKLAVYVNYKLGNNNVILGERMEYVCGFNGAIDVDGKKVSVHPAAFFQVNDHVRNALYQDALSEVGAGEIVVDAYAGAGFMSAMFAEKAEKVYGIEISKEASAGAQETAALNGIENMVSINGDCAVEVEKLLSRLQEGGQLGRCTLVLDPPKAGCDERVLSAAARLAINKIVYISCNPATLARDIKILKQAGYAPQKVRPFDMFPQTAAVETLAVLVKSKA